MATLLKKQLFLKLMSHALYVGLDTFPKIDGVVKLACGWWQIIKEAQAEVGDAERIEQVEQAAACSPEEAQQAADGALAELQAQGQVLDAERVAAVRDIMTVMPAQIRERTRATISHARRLGTEVAAVLPVTKRFKEDAQEQFYASLVPQRRPLFHAGDELPGADDWHLERLIGAGGFGEVWLARNGALSWAVKFCQDEVSAKLLVLEKKNLTLLIEKLPAGTANVVALLSTRFKTMPYWLAFEYIDGGTLESRMRLGSMTWSDTWAIFKPLLEGMAHVHKLGIVHRDLKPANILLDAQRRPRIADFGIGKILAIAEMTAMPAARRDSTVAGYGTVIYMPPEQRKGQEAHPSDDVYALGVILWQMLAGQLESLESDDDIDDLTVADGVKSVIKECRRRRDRRPADAQALLILLTPPPSPLPLTGEGVKTSTPPPSPLPLTGEGVKTSTPPPSPLPLTGEGVKTSTPPPSPLPLTGEGVKTSTSPIVAPSQTQVQIPSPVKLILPPVESIHGWSAYKVQALQKRTAEFLNTPVEYQHDLKSGGKGPVMVVIPAGSFMMGSPDNEPERRSDERQHPVTLAKPFAMGKFAVTFEDYNRFCAATSTEKPGDEGWGRGRRPVINVSWDYAVAYCAWLSSETDQTYRLPTEAEWEYCCRAGSTTPFFWGSTITPKQANYDGNYVYNGGAKGKYRQKTVPVEEFAPNAFGLYQMHGNVWEWTYSEYDTPYSGKENTCVKQDNSGTRSVRGGSWSDRSVRVRAAVRGSFTPNYCNNHLLGFRLVQD